MIPLNKKSDKETNENIQYDMKPDKSRISIEEIIEAVFERFSQGLRIIGPLFAFALIVFVGIVAHSFFYVNVSYYKLKVSSFLGYIFGLTASYCLFSILFNYILAVLVKPGSLEDIRKSKYYKKKNAYEVDKDIIDLSKILTNESNQKMKKNEFKLSYKKSDKNILEKSNEELEIIEEERDNSLDSIENRLNAIDINFNNEDSSNEYDEIDNYYRNKPIENDNSFQLVNCKYCKDPKPIRAHHCSICNTCVLKMDHHCPWINNCIGQNNHRYFVLFLTHTMLGCLLVAVTSIPLLFDESVKKTNEFNFVTTLSITAFLMLVFFNAWNWFLVFKGNTTIEYWSIKSGMINENNILKDFSMPNKEDNIFLVFGTRSILKAILIPSIKKLPISGLEWTKIAIPEYNFIGLDNLGELHITIDENSKNV